MVLGGNGTDKNQYTFLETNRVVSPQRQRVGGAVKRPPLAAKEGDAKNSKTGEDANPRRGRVSILDNIVGPAAARRNGLQRLRPA
ncbi:hypothetical protein STCU_10050 [Strigomonas culicis]|uniref:Uncharacterized protein n=1 Tax=Strigomonas culicis TaxID=28005 RepID=S9TNN9_9TRYP|nr:hypothetical protein STCU_10050 [Strigomonas culicis]|eukprot:EPY18334.1 hypothetical protein STCU_10050 [Strigomonas culicis]